MTVEQQVLDTLLLVDLGRLHPDQAYFKMLDIINDECEKARQEVRDEYRSGCVRKGRRNR